jgi:hypothetical protein
MDDIYQVLKDVTFGSSFVRFLGSCDEKDWHLPRGDCDYLPDEHRNSLLPRWVLRWDKPNLFFPFSELQYGPGSFPFDLSCVRPGLHHLRVTVLFFSLSCQFLIIGLYFVIQHTPPAASQLVRKHESNGNRTFLHFSSRRRQPFQI